jgi:hypothetical protein
MVGEGSAERGKKLTRITRRQLFRLASVLGISLALRPDSVAFARPFPPDDATKPPAQPSDQTVGDREDIPLRSRYDAVRACTLRRYEQDEMYNPPQPSALGQLLAKTPLSESRLALANWPLMDEVEDLDQGNFSFPISPYTPVADDGTQRFLLLSNSSIIANFRQWDYLESAHRRMFDRAVWAMDSGRTGVATVEFDRGLTDQKVDYMVRLLAGYGVRTIIWGNEPNSPYAPWRDNLPELFSIFSAAANSRRQHALSGLELALPGLAYFGQGEYLQKMLRTFKELQKRSGAPAWAGELPADRITDHYYGPVDGFLPRIKMMRDIMAREGVGKLKYDLMEVGNPTMDPGQPKVTDEQMAECHIPQVACLAVGSGLVDRFCYYSLLGSNWEDSITVVNDGRILKRPPYKAFVNVARLLARLDRAILTDSSDMVRLEGARSDGVDFTVLWSKVTDRELQVAVPKGKRVFSALGQEVRGDRPDQLVLKPKLHPLLAGPARILIATGS